MEKPKVLAKEINATSITLEWILHKDFADKVEIVFCSQKRDCKTQSVDAGQNTFTQTGLSELTKWVTIL